MSAVIDRNKYSSPIVDICIPTFNQKDSYLTQCIVSALKQDYPNLRLIISINGGDKTADMVLDKLIDQKIKIVRPSLHLEMAGNFDFCLSHADGDYVSFLSSDDMMLPGCISHLVELMQQHPEASFCTGNLIRSEVFPNSLIEQKKFLLRDNMIHGYFSPHACKDFLFPWRMESTWMTACLIKRSAITQSNVFTNSPFLVWGDMWLTLLLIDKGGLVISSQATGFYRQRAKNENTAYGNRVLFDYCDLLTCKRLSIAHSSFVSNFSLGKIISRLAKKVTPNFLVFIVIFIKTNPTTDGLQIAINNQSLGLLDRLALKFCLWLKV